MDDEEALAGGGGAGRGRCGSGGAGPAAGQATADGPLNARPACMGTAARTEVWGGQITLRPRRRYAWEQAGSTVGNDGDLAMGAEPDDAFHM